MEIFLEAERYLGFEQSIGVISRLCVTSAKEFSRRYQLWEIPFYQ